MLGSLYDRTGGGWFHPIHMHLVDFFVLQRNDNTGTDGLFAYERMVPKDVVYLGPGQDIYMIARFGAHRGMYMFHCHNLVHEDYDMLCAMNVVTGPPTRNPSSTLPIQQISGEWDGRQQASWVPVGASAMSNILLQQASRKALQPSVAYTTAASPLVAVTAAAHACAVAMHACGQLLRVPVLPMLLYVPC